MPASNANISTFASLEGTNNIIVVKAFRICLFYDIIILSQLCLFSGIVEWLNWIIYSQFIKMYLNNSINPTFILLFTTMFPFKHPFQENDDIL